MPPFSKTREPLLRQWQSLHLRSSSYPVKLAGYGDNPSWELQRRQNIVYFVKVTLALRFNDYISDECGQSED